MKARVIFATAIVGFSFLFLFIAVERPMWRSSKISKMKIAAVAYRDNVIPFQKFGSKMFTVPALTRGYDSFVYLTDRGDRLKAERQVAATIEKLARTHDAVDLYILAHSNRVVAAVKQIDPKALAKIRLVYNTGCADAYQSAAWLKVGAQAYVGHPGKNSVSPVFYVLFLRRWLAGDTVGVATEKANRLAQQRIKVLGGLASGFKFSGDELARSTHAIASGSQVLTIR